MSGSRAQLSGGQSRRISCTSPAALMAQFRGQPFFSRRANFIFSPASSEVTVRMTYFRKSDSTEMRMSQVES